MINLFKSEFMKLYKSSSLKIIILLGIAMSLIFHLTVVTHVTGYNALVGSMQDTPLVMLLAGIFAGLFIGNDFSNRTIQSEISLGYTRFKVFLSKSIVFLIGSCIIILIYPITSIIICNITNGFGEIINYNIIKDIIRMVLLFLIVNCGTLSVCVIVGFTVRNVGASIGSSIGILIIGSVIIDAISNKYNFNKFTTVGWSKLILIPNMTIIEILQALIVSGVTLIISLFVAYLIFKKADLK